MTRKSFGLFYSLACTVHDNLFLLPSALHQPGFYNLKNPPSTELNVVQYHTKGYQFTECHAMDHELTECRTTEYRSRRYGANSYQMSYSHATDNLSRSCHVIEEQRNLYGKGPYQTSGGHATELKKQTSDKRLTERCAGLGYDHGVFPKIISVHSMTGDVSPKSRAKSATESSVTGQTTATTTEAHKICHEISTAAERVEGNVSMHSNNRLGNGVTNNSSCSNAKNGTTTLGTKFQGIEEKKAHSYYPVLTSLSPTGTQFDCHEPSLIQDGHGRQKSVNASRNEMNSECYRHDDKHNAKEEFKKTNAGSSEVGLERDRVCLLFVSVLFSRNLDVGLNRWSIQGSKLTEKILSQFCDRVEKFSRNFANFSRKIVELHCLVSGLAKQNMSLQYLCAKKALKMANDRGKQHRCYSTRR